MDLLLGILLVAFVLYVVSQYFRGKDEGKDEGK